MVVDDSVDSSIAGPLQCLRDVIVVVIVGKLISYKPVQKTCLISMHELKKFAGTLYLCFMI